MRFHVAVVLTGVLLTSSSVLAQPFVQRGPKLAGTGSINSSVQGTSVAISADGSTAVVGGEFDNSGVGAVWVFTRSNGVWTQQGPKLIGSGAVGKAFQGSSVAISGDGNTILSGGWRDNFDVSAVWVFVRSGGVWTQDGPKLVGAGANVALSADGNTALLGPSVFVRTGSTWAQQGSTLVGTGAMLSTEPPPAVALSGDGNTALIGHTSDDSDVGAAWVFVRSGSTWTQQGGKLTPTGSVRPHFGSAVALSGDGNTAVIGGPLDHTSTWGAVWVFTRTGGTWAQQGPKLVGTDSAGLLGNQGTSVSISGDGNRLFSGAPRDGADDQGATWTFVRTGTTWTQAGNKLFGTGYTGDPNFGPEQGRSVAVSADGLTAIVGGRNDHFGTGAVWIFGPSDEVLRTSDHDGDALSEITVYHSASGVWSSLTSASGFTATTSRSWGGSAYVPVPGDYDGDGKTDIGVYDPSTANWYVLLSSTGFTSVLWKNAGGPGWQAVPRDYDGDGKTDFVVYNVTTGQWWGLTSSTNYAAGINVGWGGSGYLAVPADYDGDRKADLGVYNTTTGVWSVLLSSSNYTTALGQACGGTGWTPVPADYDGDGKADIVVYNNNPGQWFGLKSTSNYTTALNVMWGGSTYEPIRGDFDGDGRADLATYVSDTGMFYILLSGANYTTSLARAWGGPGYTAIPQYP